MIVNTEHSSFKKKIKLFRQISTTLSDVLRLKLSIDCIKNLNSTQVIGDDFINSGCCLKAFPSQFKYSIFKNNICLDPASHTLHTPYYFRPFQSIISGGLPIPVGFEYPHVKTNFPIKTIDNKNELYY